MPICVKKLVNDEGDRKQKRGNSYQQVADMRETIDYLNKQAKKFTSEKNKMNQEKLRLLKIKQDLESENEDLKQ